MRLLLVVFLLTCSCMVVSFSSMRISLMFAILNQPSCMIVCLSAVSSYLCICKAKAVKLLQTVMNIY